MISVTRGQILMSTKTGSLSAAIVNLVLNQQIKVMV